MAKLSVAYLIVVGAKISDFDKIWCTVADIKPDEILKSAITVS